MTEALVQARLFGRFAEQDTLVLTAFHTRALFKGKGTAQWREAMHQCRQTWDDLFVSIQPMSADFVGAYVSENYDDFPLCP